MKKVILNILGYFLVFFPIICIFIFECLKSYLNVTNPIIYLLFALFQFPSMMLGVYLINKYDNN